MVDLLRKTVPSPSKTQQKITRVDFSTMGSEEIRRMSNVSVSSTELYELNSLKPAINGALDLRLGSTTEAYVCQTCGKNSADCPGHFGRVELVLPIFNFGYYKAIIDILKCVCKTCSNILLPDQEINRLFRRILGNPINNVNARLERLKRLKTECDKVLVCPHCGALNGDIRKTKNLLIISHNIGRKNPNIQQIFQDQLESIELANYKKEEMEKLIKTASDDITPIRALQIFDNIPPRQIPILTNGLKITHPKEMIISTLIVPPSCIRPPVITGEGTNQDDLTVRITEAVKFNLELKKAIDFGLNPNNLIDQWNGLQQDINAFISSDCSDTAAKAKKKDKPVIGICQRLKGKQGRFRTNLSGKRVNFSGRTVISPDPNCNVDQVVVPEEMAMTLTFPTRVTKFNRSFLRELVRHGPYKYPGADRILPVGSNYKISLRGDNIDLNARAQQLKDGDIVERHLLPDDIILFNRQPSLHKISIMAFRAKIMKWRTMRFNVCTCAPFNADFDGDEMNIHLPQTLEAACDAKVLMNILSNLFSPRNGELIVAPTQDFLSGSYLLTRKDVFMDYDHFTFLATQIFDGAIPLIIPPPAIFVPKKLWTGKQLISLMLKPNNDPNQQLHFTHSIPNKEYSGSHLHMLFSPSPFFNIYSFASKLHSEPNKCTESLNW